MQDAISHLKKEIAAQKENKDESASEARATRVDSLNRDLKQHRKRHDTLVETIPATLVMKEKKEIRDAHILIRGVYDQKGDKVERNTPGFLPPLKKQSEIASRLDLANWLVGSSNPLTARVTVNRFWQQLFGVGIVKTSEDFGVQGELPSHPELLRLSSAQSSNLDGMQTTSKVACAVLHLPTSSTAQPSISRRPRESTSSPEAPQFRLFP